MASPLCAVAFLLMIWIMETPSYCTANGDSYNPYHFSYHTTISNNEPITKEELRPLDSDRLLDYDTDALQDYHQSVEEQLLMPQYLSQSHRKETLGVYHKRKNEATKEEHHLQESFSNLKSFSSSPRNREERDGASRGGDEVSLEPPHGVDSVPEVREGPADNPEEEEERMDGTESQGATESDNSVDLRAIGHSFCRSQEKFFPRELYALDACALCYWYIQNADHFVTKWYKSELRDVFYSHNNQSYYFNIAALTRPFSSVNASQELVEARITSTDLLESFAGDEGRQKWISCCKAAEVCCSEMLQQPWTDGNCPPTWDGWQCWPLSLPSTVVQRPCPSYSYNGKPSSCSKMATKQCEAEGRWFRRLDNQQEWSNYSSCSVAENIILRLYVHTAAYSISVAALLPALCIFFSYKQLRVHRITLHKHLFISLLIEAVGNISLRLIQLHEEDLIQQNHLGCIGLSLLTKYASLTNYMWYFCEGYYLHKLLASAFAEQNNLISFYIIGWVLPLVPLTIYTIFRAIGHYNAECWLVPIDLDWIIQLPPLLAIVINVVFVINIIRILVNKVRASNSNEPSQYRKAVRATMMVVPLFGLQYIVTIYRPQGHGCDWHDFYQISNNIIEGSTGLVVAIIFCYTNGEVKMLLRRSLMRLQERRALPRGSSYRGSLAVRSRSCSTVQTTLVDPSPARRNSSIVSICTNSLMVRRNNSGANSSQLLTGRDSRNNISQLPHSSHVDYGGIPLIGSSSAAAARRSPKSLNGRWNPVGSETLASLSNRNSLHNLDSNSMSRSPSLLEEVEDEQCVSPSGRDSLLVSRDSVAAHKGGVHPTVEFRKDESEPSSVTINIRDQETINRTSDDQGYESSPASKLVDE